MPCLFYSSKFSLNRGSASSLERPPDKSASYLLKMSSAVLEPISFQYSYRLSFLCFSAGSFLVGMEAVLEVASIRDLDQSIWALIWSAYSLFKAALISSNFWVLLSALLCDVLFQVPNKLLPGFCCC
jgi:hypothetical protein